MSTHLNSSIRLPLANRLRTHNAKSVVIASLQFAEYNNLSYLWARSRGGRYEYVTHFADWNFSKIIFREPLGVSLLYTNPDCFAPFVYFVYVASFWRHPPDVEAFAAKAHWSSNLPCYDTRDIVMKITAAEKVSLELRACREVGVMYAFVESLGVLFCNRNYPYNLYLREAK